MRILSRAGSVVLLALIVSAAQAEPIDALKPMAFLAGHCWLGTFADGKQTDQHCFTWLYNGKALRDAHVVRSANHPDYAGETTYFWDSAKKRLEFFYLENLGGISRGTVETVPGAIVVPAAEFVGDGQAMTYRVRWTRQGDDAYEAWSESKDLTAWTTMFKVVMHRQ
jgi:hypothetical protein